MSNPFSTAIVVFGLVFSLPLSACEDDVPCDKCVKASEFSWNPDNQFVSQRLKRFYSMEDRINSAYLARNYDSASRLIDEYLDLADLYRCNWNYGNAIHEANRIEGLISLGQGNIENAANYLVEAGKSPGSPQLDSFGPELDLANELLKIGKKEEVIFYLSGVETFWDMDDGQVEKWLKRIERGERPNLNRYAYSFNPWNWTSLNQALFLLALFIGMSLYVRYKRPTDKRLR